MSQSCYLKGYASIYHGVYPIFHAWKEIVMDDETATEAETAERDDMTPEEAHRAGEIDDLRDMLRHVRDKLDAVAEMTKEIKERYSDGLVEMVENGAVINDTPDADDVAEAIAAAAADDLENLDYEL